MRMIIPPLPNSQGCCKDERQRLCKIAFIMESQSTV